MRLFLAMLLALVCALPAAGFAQAAARRVDIPAGEMVGALDQLARQTGAQFIYDANQLRGVHTAGVHGTLTTDQALNRLLQGSGFGVKQDGSGAMVIVKTAAPAAPAAQPPPPPLAPTNQAAANPQTLQEVVVTGSRIPRAQIEGPAPVVTITAQDIHDRGFASVPDIMTSLTQNLGSLDNNQQTDGFSPGAQAVDLRGLGPNHTLVLVNGRRIADYPQSYNGNSNFTDISNLPASMIDRVEILSGSASAVYGSDAISGVINFILKKKADGTTIDFRVGGTEHGGGTNERFQISSGFSKGNFDSVFGLELYNELPLWAFQRSFTDSRLDAPIPHSDVVASQVWLRTDEDGDYLDPGKATCDALSGYDKGTVFYASRADYGYDPVTGEYVPGYYCGSYYDVGYGTLENGRKMANFFGSATYHVNDHMDLFLDVLASASHQDSYNTPLQWYNCEPLNGDCTDTPFYNTATGQVEEWSRRYFTIEENGGFKAGMIRNINQTLSFNTGLRGSFGQDDKWNYEATYSHSQNKLESKWPALVAAKAQALYLGPSLGIDPDSGYEMFYAPPSRLYTPLTVDQFRSITQDSIDNDKSRADIVSFTLDTTELFHLPAGPVGFAGVAEYGTQYFGLKADPLSLNGSYYGLHNTDAVGSRSHSGVGAELRIPVFSQLTISTAGRYDKYSYSSTSSGKYTYNLGLEYRPFQSLLLRGSLGTSFRAPDLSYLYAGESGSSSGGTDYWQCRLLEPETGPDFSDCDWGDVGFNGRSHGSTDLKDETGKSFTYGFVFSPTPNLDISADYYNIKLNNEVEYQDSDTILREEADCRLGQDINGNPVDGNSSFCQQIESQVVRNPPTAGYNPNGITSVLVLPINAAVDQTSGIDLHAHYRWDAHSAGIFDFNFGATWVKSHTIQLSPDTPPDDELTDLYYYVIPRSKANYSVAWTYHKLTATLYGARLGGLPNYDGTKRLGPTFLYNTSFDYRFSPQMSASFIVDNLFDSKPGKDDTWTSYPYYASRWFSPVGRAYFLEFNYRFGGTAQ